MFSNETENHCGANCTGKCVLIGKSGFHDIYKCIATSTYYFCKETMSTYLIVISCLIGLNFIAFIGAGINDGYITDCVTFSVSIFQNIAFVSFIMGITCTATFSMNAGYMIAIQIGLIGGIVINSVAFFILRRNRSRVNIFKNDGKTADIGSFDEYASKAHFNPPIVKNKGIVSYQMYPGDTKFTIFKDYVPYQSWRAESSPEPITLKGHSIVKVENDFTFSDNLRATILERRRNITHSAYLPSAELIENKLHNKVYKVKKEKIFGSNCLLSFYNSCLGKFVFGVSHIFGLSAFMENIYGITTKIVHIRTKRTISGSNDLPTAALSPDSKAINGDICEQMPQSLIPRAQIFFMGPNEMPINQNQVVMYQNQIHMAPINQNQMHMQMNQNLIQTDQNMMEVPYIGGIQMQPQNEMSHTDDFQNPYINEA